MAVHPLPVRKIVDAVVEMTKERGSAVTAMPFYQLLSSKDSDSTTVHWKDWDKYIISKRKV